MNSIKINKVMSFQSLFSFNNSNSPDLQIQNNYLPSQFIPITWLIFDPKKVQVYKSQRVKSKVDGPWGRRQRIALSGFCPEYSVRFLSVKIKSKFEIRTLENPPD